MDGVCPFGYHPWGMGFGFLFTILIFVVFFLVVWWLLKSNGLGNTITRDSPMDILKKRLARGEISKKEYEELKKEIQ